MHPRHHRRHAGGQEGAAVDGARESAHDWRALLLDLKRRGLSTAPKVAVADGALGFWKAIGEVWPKISEQRCWVHKSANILNKLPKSQQPKAKRMLQDIWMAGTRTDAEAAFDAFVETYAVKYEKAVECLKKDRDPLLAFYDFPAEHWKHLRTSNPIEAPLRPSDTGRSARRDASRTGPHSPWCSSWSKARRRPGVALTAITSCQRSFEV
jgi:transposase-like protein